MRTPPGLYRSRHEQSTTKVALVKATKPPRQLMRFVWRTETMVFADHKVAITEQFKDCQAYSKLLPREELRALVKRLALSLEKYYAGVY